MYVPERVPEITAMFYFFGAAVTSQIGSNHLSEPAILRALRADRLGLFAQAY
jgi:hypothetical protein